MMNEAIMALLRSRKFLLTAWGLIQTAILHFWVGADMEVIVAADALVIALIGTIALEDAAEKRATTYVQEAGHDATE